MKGLKKSPRGTKSIIAAGFNPPSIEKLILSSIGTAHILAQLDKTCTVPTELNHTLYFFGGLKPAAIIFAVPLGRLSKVDEYEAFSIIIN
jgi:hypothetical protein